MANESDELPDLPVRHVPCRHAGVSDAVADVIKHLAVGDRCDGCVQWRHPRIFARAGLGFTATLIGVTDLAFLLEQLASCRDFRRIGAERVSPRFVPLGYARVEEPRRDSGFDYALFGPRARQPGHEP